VSRDEFLVIVVLLAPAFVPYWVASPHTMTSSKVVRLLAHAWAMLLAAGAFVYAAPGGVRNATLTASVAVVAQYWVFNVLERLFERRIGREPKLTMTRPGVSVEWPDRLISLALFLVMCVIFVAIIEVGRHSRPTA
jgi:CDP-diglyceride synthetase